MGYINCHIHIHMFSSSSKHAWVKASDVQAGEELLIDYSDRPAAMASACFSCRPGQICSNWPTVHGYNFGKWVYVIYSTINGYTINGMIYR